MEGTELLEKGEQSILYERDHIHDFGLMSLERIKCEYFYPVFLKTEIFNLPENFTLRTEFE